MCSLLESVQTPKLKAAFEKYLPAVLNNKAPEVATERSVLTESALSEVTGDKTAKVNAVDVDTNVIAIKRLAGLN
jgi:hypothetical protein